MPLIANNNGHIVSLQGKRHIVQGNSVCRKNGMSFLPSMSSYLNRSIVSPLKSHRIVIQYFLFSQNDN